MDEAPITIDQLDRRLDGIEKRLRDAENFQSFSKGLATGLGLIVLGILVAMSKAGLMGL